MARTVFDQLPDADKENSFHQTSFLVKQCIDHNALEDALLLAEMLHERVSTEESRLIVCDCLLRLNRKEEVYQFLYTSAAFSHNCRLRYLYAKCCFDLKKYDECIRVLIDDKVHFPAQLHRMFDDSPTAPFAGSLLAMVFSQTGRVELAISEGARSIQQNPFVWSTSCKYVQLGGKNVRECMKPLDENVPVASPKKPAPLKKGLTPKKTPLITTAAPTKFAAPKKTKSAAERSQPPIIPVEARRSLRIYSSMSQENTENVGGRAGMTRGSTPRGMKNQGLRNPPKGVESPPQVLSRRTRDAKPLASRSANAMRSLSSSTTSVASSADAMKDSDVPMEEVKVKPVKPLEPILKEIYETIQELAEVEEAVAGHKWTHATDLIAALPLKSYRHTLAQLQRARVMFELSNYESARDILQTLRDKQPHIIEGAELLSTALWQLQDAHGLSLLAQELTTHHRRRPQTWLVVGNCFSLQRQHQLAVDCMERAVMLDPHFAYAYTLLGHELVYVDELDRASRAFRAALNITPLDYRAWYGLGQVHQRTEQPNLARHTMTRAIEINPSSMGILVSLAQLEQHQGHLDEAMEYLTRALEISPKDIAVRYNRARLLYDMHREEECLEELNTLKELSPDEAYIFHLLGKVHRRLNNTHKALLNYTWATEMDPRGEQMQAHGLSDNYSDDSFSPPAQQPAAENADDGNRVTF